MDILLLIAFAALGAIFGSFIGVVAERTHTGQSWKHGRSRCNSCAVPLTGRDLVPVLSYLFTRGRCRSCGARVPATYPLLETTVAAGFALMYAQAGLTLLLPVLLAAVVVAVYIVVYDLRHTIVPDSASSLLVSLGLLGSYIAQPDLMSWGYTLMTAGIIASLFYFLHVFSGGRAMGLGDTPVALGLSLLFAPYALAGLLFSFWIGALCGIAILVMRKGGPTMGIEVPFVPFLALGYLIAYIIQWNPLSLPL